VDVRKKVKVLIASDGSDCADAALHDLRRAGLPHDVEAVIITVAEVILPPPLPVIADAVKVGFPQHLPAVPSAAGERAFRAVEEAYALATRARERLWADFPSWDVHAEAHGDSPAWAIIKKADEWNPDLVVVGSHGRSTLGRMLLGSVSQMVVIHARCSVRVARGRIEAQDPPVRIVVGVDGSPDAASAVQVIGERLWPHGSEVRVITALNRQTAATALMPDASDADERQSAHNMVAASMERLRAAGLVVSSVIRAGDPKQLLPEEAEHWKADCIFVGARGLRRIERFFLGSVSAAVAARAHCSVEVTRAGQKT
jgi:nucleotide-binding universal stress UspA family protein